MTWLLSFALKLLTSGAADKVLDYLKTDAARQTGEAQIRANVTIAEIEAAVSHTRIMADLQKSKFANLPYWIFAGLFVLPLGFWWSAVILDSVFLFGWHVAIVPILEEWGGQMIRWIFYTGTVVGAVKMLK